jgi:hypothetical protein
MVDPAKDQVRKLPLVEVGTESIEDLGRIYRPAVLAFLKERRKHLPDQLGLVLGSFPERPPGTPSISSDKAVYRTAVLGAGFSRVLGEVLR